ncbi:hypothetical protein V8C37DRAFT_397241, partial [Trichoderma ceciliae]
MFVRFLILFPTFITLSHAVQLCVLGDPILQFPAGSNFNVLLPQYAEQCRAKVQFNPYSISSPLQYTFKTIDCADGFQTARMEIPTYVPNGPALLTWECKDMNSCGTPLYISEGVEDASGSRELEGGSSCVSGWLVKGAPSWSVLTYVYDKAYTETSATAKVPFMNTTAASNLHRTASSAMWITASILPVITISSSNRLSGALGNVTPQAQATTTESQYTSISIHPKISQAKPPGKPTSDPTISYSGSNHVVPFAFV